MVMELEGWVPQCRSLDVPILPTADLARRRSLPMKGSMCSCPHIITSCLQDSI
jgi:hypothetical protein